jgi:ankyrin repeat protein
LVSSKDDNYGQTPLHLAAGMGHKDVAEVLLAGNAEVNAKSDIGRTPLHLAAVFDHKDVAEVLRQHGGQE